MSDTLIDHLKCTVHCSTPAGMSLQAECRVLPGVLCSWLGFAVNRGVYARSASKFESSALKGFAYLAAHGCLCQLLLPTYHIMCIFRVVLLPLRMRHLIVSIPNTW